MSIFNVSAAILCKRSVTLKWWTSCLNLWKMKKSVASNKSTTTSKSTATKTRSKNFSEEESRVLLSACDRHHNIINKNSNRSTDKLAKVKAWAQIKNGFDNYCRTQGIYVCKNLFRLYQYIQLFIMFSMIECIWTNFFTIHRLAIDQLSNCKTNTKHWKRMHGKCPLMLNEILHEPATNHCFAAHKKHYKKIALFYHFVLEWVRQHLVLPVSIVSTLISQIQTFSFA